MEVFQDVRTIWRQLQSSFRHPHDWSRIVQHDKLVAEYGRLCLADRDTDRHQVHSGKCQRGVSSGKEGVNVERSVLVLWLDESGDGRH